MRSFVCARACARHVLTILYLGPVIDNTGRINSHISMKPLQFENYEYETGNLHPPHPHPLHEYEGKIFYNLINAFSFHR